MTTSAVSQAVILAGGLGTRLGELTEQTPKPLLPVGRDAFVDVLVNELARHGIAEVLISAGYQGEKLRAHFRTWRPRAGLSCSVRIVIEPEPLGTGGAVQYLTPELEERFLLLNGDSWFDLDWVDFLRRPTESPFPAKLALRKVDDVARYGSIELDGNRVLAFREKGPAGPGLINTGVYLLDRSVLEPTETGSWSLEQRLFPRLATQDRLGGQVYDGYFLDIGTPESFARAQHEIPARLGKPVLLVSGRDLTLLLSPPSALRELRSKGYYLFLADPQGELPERTVLNRRLAAAGGLCDRILAKADLAEPGRSIPQRAAFDDWGGLRPESLMLSTSAEDMDLAKRLGVPFRRTDHATLGDALHRLPDVNP